MLFRIVPLKLKSLCVREKNVLSQGETVQFHFFLHSFVFLSHFSYLDSNLLYVNFWVWLFGYSVAIWRICILQYARQISCDMQKTNQGDAGKWFVARSQLQLFCQTLKLLNINTNTNTQTGKNSKSSCWLNPKKQTYKL